MPAFELVTTYANLARMGHKAVEFEGRIIFGGGYDGTNYLNDVWETDDGVNYNQLCTGAYSFSTRFDHAMVVHNNRIYIIAGFGAAGQLADVWESLDGKTWNRIVQTAFPARWGHAAYSYDQHLWVVGGYNTDGQAERTDVWKSRDGVTWDQVLTGYAPISRHGAGYCVYDNRMWLACGYDGSVIKTCYSTQDGTNWTRHDTGGTLPAVYMPTLTNFDSKMVLIGGDTTLRSDTPIDDLYTSQNGENWIVAVKNLGFSVHSHAAPAYTKKQRMYVLFGHTAAAETGRIWQSKGVEFSDREANII